MSPAASSPAIRLPLSLPPAAFLGRCHDVLDMTGIIMTFSKLERIVIGGTKGAALTATLGRIHGDFKSAVAAFEAVPYDLMDVSRRDFDADFAAFRARIREMERRLGAVLTQVRPLATSAWCWEMERRK